jgi:hypothetical protein
MDLVPAALVPVRSTSALAQKFAKNSLTQAAFSDARSIASSRLLATP